MTNISELILACLLKNKINEGWGIIDTHFFPREDPVVKIVSFSRNMGL